MRIASFTSLFCFPGLLIVGVSTVGASMVGADEPKPVFSQTPAERAGCLAIAQPIETGPLLQKKRMSLLQAPSHTTSPLQEVDSRRKKLDALEGQTLKAILKELFEPEIEKKLKGNCCIG